MAGKDAKAEAAARLKALLEAKPYYSNEDLQDLAIIHAANAEGSDLCTLEGFAYVALTATGDLFDAKAKAPYTHVRLYLDLTCTSWVDVRADDVRVLRRYAQDRTPLGRIYMLVNAGAQLRYGQNASVDEFLQGAIAQEQRNPDRDDDDLNSVAGVLRSLSRAGAFGGYSTGRGPC